MSESAMKALFDSLDSVELRNVAACCTLSMEDIRQEAKLLCWSIASGQCDFDTLQGTARQYIMGHLWGLSLRYQIPVRLDSRLDDISHGTESPWVREMLLVSPYAQEPVDPLTDLVNREEEQERETLIRGKKKAVMARLSERDKTFAEMLLSAPIDQVADLYGLTVRATHYRQVELLKRLDAHNGL